MEMSMLGGRALILLILSFRDDSLWSEEFLDFIRETLVKDWQKRPHSSDLSNHQFLLQVPQNPGGIRSRLLERMWAIKGKKNKGGAEIIPTVRKG